MTMLKGITNLKKVLNGARGSVVIAYVISLQKKQSQPGQFMDG